MGLERGDARHQAVDLAVEMAPICPLDDPRSTNHPVTRHHHGLAIMRQPQQHGALVHLAPELRLAIRTLDGHRGLSGVGFLG
jgi:hypothetical protein